MIKMVGRDASILKKEVLISPGPGGPVMETPAFSRGRRTVADQLFANPNRLYRIPIS
jgi:hypothetical protein